MDWILTQTAAAELVGRKPVFLRDHGCPNVSRGKYDAREVVKWHNSIVLGDESVEVLRLKEEKLKGEIEILQRRAQKMETEELRNQGRLVDVNELLGLQTELANCIRKTGDLMGRKSKLTGRDAQQILNKALDDFAKLLKERLPKKEPSK